MTSDFGSETAQLTATSGLFKLWDVDYIMSGGDSQHPGYDLSRVLAQSGYGALIRSGRFFSALGNHERASVEEFQLERQVLRIPAPLYYDVVIGDVHYFMVDSGFDNNQVNQQPDGVTQNSVQGAWLRDGLAASVSRVNIVVMHHPAYTSCYSTVMPNNRLEYAELRWPYKDWGAHLVAFGHAHTYERLEVDGFPYINVGAAAVLANFNPTPSEFSVVRYNALGTAIRARVGKDKLFVEAYSTDQEIVDYFSVPI